MRPMQCVKCGLTVYTEVARCTDCGGRLRRVFAGELESVAEREDRRDRSRVHWARVTGIFMVGWGALLIWITYVSPTGTQTERDHLWNLGMVITVSGALIIAENLFGFILYVFVYLSAVYWLFFDKLRPLDEAFLAMILPSFVGLVLLVLTIRKRLRWW